jgi:hypothetical protein
MQPPYMLGVKAEKIGKSTKKFLEYFKKVFNLKQYLKLSFNRAEPNRFDMPG